MSTWTSKARPFAVQAVLVSALAGCVLPGGAEAPLSVAVADGSVVVGGPRGFCIDPEGSRTGGPGAFVLLGSCASIAGLPFLPHPPVTAVLTATVSVGSEGGTIAGSEAELAAYFRSPEGRAALSRTNDADRVAVISAGVVDEVFVLHARAVPPKPGTPRSGPAEPPDTWRALIDLNGRIVTLSVLALPDKPIAEADGSALLGQFVARVRKLSPDRTAAVTKAGFWSFLNQRG